MLEHIHLYFRAEKSESLLFIVIGLAALGLSLWFWLGVKQAFYSGMAVPLTLIAAIQITVGGTVYARTDEQVAQVVRAAEQDAQAMAASELPRMETVNRNFDLYRYIESALIVAGALLLVFVRREFWLGLGLGLLLQSTLMITLDLFAERRADVYTAELHALQR